MTSVSFFPTVSFLEVDDFIPCLLWLDFDFFLVTRRITSLPKVMQFILDYPYTLNGTLEACCG